MKRGCGLDVPSVRQAIKLTRSLAPFAVPLSRTEDTPIRDDGRRKQIFRLE